MGRPPVLVAIAGIITIFCGVSCPEEQQAEHAKAEWWIERALQLVNSPQGAPAHDDVISDLAWTSACSGDMSRFWALLATADDKVRINATLFSIPSVLVMRGRIDEANEIVAHVNSDNDRDCVRAHMTRGFARRHEFDHALQVLSDIKADRWRNNAITRITEAQAEAGRWDEAEATLDKLVIVDENDDREDLVEEREDLIDEKARLETLIQNCRANKIARPPQSLPNDAAASWRAALQLFGSNATIDDIGRARLKAAVITDPEKLATVWRGIAWFYQQKGDTSQALDAVSRGAAAARRIGDPYMKSLNLILLADIYLELGETDPALALIPEALSSEGQMMNLMRGITGFTTGPVIIGVLVRAGHPDDVLKMLRSAKSEPEVGWMAFGQFCAETDRLDYAARLLDGELTATARARLATGVASSLKQLSERATNPKSLDSQN
ncbi:MAG: tetratricopeptide repeat protein [Thermoguttaceae bacterium]